ncbi:MAG TPA: 50S ribosomal protein L17 [Candidatus Paceibacterota bacterium]|jgi:large subunit ribosomal protein L17|nr:50S ribosomal protein L17 [Candidatus Paceibacterota bacterium]
MRHGNVNRKFGRERGQRVALLKSLARNLVIKGKIKTTEARAKEIRPIVEKLLTKAKNPTLANRRMLIVSLGAPATAAKLIRTAGNYTERTGGYLRITKMGPRKGDAANMAVIEFV